MRAIKFRAWDKEVGIMRSDFVQLDFAKKHPEIVELMQYTGLKDKNGKEIYEGDICTWEKRRWGDYKKAIEWRDGRFWWGDSLVICCDMECKLMEVVGNIYENPELLEGSK